MRICIAYDCLYPWTVGGGERWFRSLAERLAAEGHQVTYLTRLQWDPNDAPEIPGVRVIAVSREEPLYGPDGNRRVAEALHYGWGILRHLAAHGSEYDVVHTSSFPYFSLLAPALLRPIKRFRLVVDWFEVWSSDYWISYLGPVRGRIGLLIQSACARVPQAAHCFSSTHSERLAELGSRSAPIVIGGLYDGPTDRADTREAGDTALFAGRLIREKNVSSAVRAVGTLRDQGVELKCLIVGDGPEYGLANDLIGQLGLNESTRLAGFVDRQELEDQMSTALCLLHPSEREGYGLVVLEAASHGTPSVVVDHPDNASRELVEDGVNGFVARSAEPEDLANAVKGVIDGGVALRASTRKWFDDNVDEFSLEKSLESVAASYAERGR